MLTARASESQRDSEKHPGADDELSVWIKNHLPPGRVLNLGTSDSSVTVESTQHSVVTVRHLASALKYEAIFDHVCVSGFDATADPADVVTKIHGAMKPGGMLILVIPFGISRDATDRPVFYLGSARRLVEPLFDIVDLPIIQGKLVLAGKRRDKPTGEAKFSLDPYEVAFIDHERRLNADIDDRSRQIIRSGTLYRGLFVRAEALQTKLERTTQELLTLRQKVARLKRWLAVPLAGVRKVRQLQRGTTRQGHAAATFVRSRLGNAPPAETALAVPLQRTAPLAEQVNRASGSALSGILMSPLTWRETLRARFEAWLATACQADGDEVVVMFSGTTFVQEQRANRPIRLTKVYLRKNSPVFFNYYRWSEKDFLPEHPDLLLFQSPIDATPTFLDELLTADFGSKKKIFFASFPHELMVRYLTAAAQYGWVTVYDARDDWEEFAKVGMAKWYHPGYERYVVTHADIATAVSRPLARKMSALGGNRVVHVVPNGLDPEFPRSPLPRRPSRPPVVGYFGHLTDKWFDWPLVIAAAERYPTYRFELAGHQQPKLQLPANVKLLGLLGHTEIAERSREWSVAIIPFKNGPLADAVDPIKIYEYLHLGLPVLATYFPQCRDYPGTVITEGRDEFLEQLPRMAETVLTEHEVDGWLALNTWERRVAEYGELANEVRQRGRSGVMALLGDDW